MDREQNALVLTTSPHVRADETVQRIMLDVLIALFPAMVVGVYLFGARVIWVMLVSVLAAGGTEALFQRIAGQPVAVSNLSACVTGVLLAYNLPPGIPLWLAAIGSFVAIGFAKMLFGGLGKNIFNPALVGRAVLLAAWPLAMTKGYLKPLWWRTDEFSFWAYSVSDRLGVAVDAVTSATPLIKGGAMPDPFTVQSLFLGNVGGCIGETSALVLLVGACYLLYRKLIYWQLPVSFVATTGLLMWVFGGENGLFTGEWLAQILAGGLILGAFFMATDMVTSPMTRSGQTIMGIGCGFIAFLIRLKGGPPEGVSYSILLMNALTPIIDRYTAPKVFGETKSE